MKEIIVDPNTGKWYTVGDNGAEFTNIPQGAIVFNHKQTEALLKYGRVSGRGAAHANGSAFASGSAMVTGGGLWGESSWIGAGYGGSSAGMSILEELIEWFFGSGDSNSRIDWIEIAVDRIERAINRLDKVASSAFKNLDTKMGASADEIEQITKELAVQNAARIRYSMQASAGMFSGLSYDMMLRIQNGAIDIREYDEDTQKLIKDYQEWYEKSLDASDAVDELHEKLAQLYQANFDSIKGDFDNQMELLERRVNMLTNGVDTLEAKGYVASVEYNKALQEMARGNIEIMENEVKTLEETLQTALNSGEIQEGSEAWYAMQIEINGVRDSIDEANLSLIEYSNTIREIQWGYFDRAIDNMRQVNEEAEFMLNLIGDNKLFDENGNFNTEGDAALGLHAQEYAVYMSLANKYAKEMLELDKELADDPYNTTLLDRRKELLESQREYILNAESEKDAIQDLVRNGLEEQLNALKDLIDKYTDALDSAKDLYDYNKKINSQTEELRSIEKQIAAYQGDMSEESMARMQKLNASLNKAKESLQETEYQQYISDQKKLLDDLYEEYEKVINDRIDNVDQLLSDIIAYVNSNSKDIISTLNDAGDKVGYRVSAEMNSIWESISGSVLTEYGDAFDEQLTGVNVTLNDILINVKEMVSKSDAIANSIIATQTDVVHPGEISIAGEGLGPLIEGLVGSAAGGLLGGFTMPIYDLIHGNLNLGSLIPGGIGDIISEGIYGYGLNMNVNDIISKIGSLFNPSQSGDYNVNIAIDHVEDYDDFVSKLKMDGSFEQFIQSISIARIAGASPLEKYRYY